MNRCADCEHNSLSTREDRAEHCTFCAELNDNSDELHYKKRCINNATPIITCSYAGKGVGIACDFASFSTRESDKKIGRDAYCEHADFTGPIAICMCEAAREASIKAGNFI